MYCGGEDDARHTLIDCHRWDAERDKLRRVLGVIDPGIIVTRMIEDKRSFDAMAEFSRILKIKLQEERMR